MITFEMPEFRYADIRVYELANLEAAIFQIERLRRFRGIWTNAVRTCMTIGTQEPSNRNLKRLALDGSRWRLQHREEGQSVDWRAGMTSG